MILKYIIILSSNFNRQCVYIRAYVLLGHCLDNCVEEQSSS